MILFKKALRSIWRGRRSYAACIGLIALGIASYVGFGLTSIRLLATMDQMYAAQSFGDVFATVKGIPPGVAVNLSRLDGIREVSARTTADVRVLHDGDALLTLHIISWDVDADTALNQFILQQGSAPGRGQILVSEAFYRAQNLSIGDQITLMLDGRQLRPEISGVAISPEYIYQQGDGLANGYAYMPPLEVNTLADSGGLGDNLSFRLSEGVVYRDVEAALEDALDRYGLKSLVPRKDFLSHQVAWSNFTSLTSTAGMISVVFLSVAVLVLYILLRRVIQQERIQIGTMKAFGFSGGKIMLLYMGYGAVTGLAGGLLGTVGGLGIANVFTSMYLSIFPMPAMAIPLDMGLIVSALALSAGAGIAAAAMGANTVLSLSPAEAMRPPSPPIMKKSISPLSARISRRMPLSFSMALRGISRSKFRSGFVVFGMAVSFAILTFMSSYAAILDDVIMDQFEYVQLYDMKVTLKDRRSFTPAVESAYRLKGVTEVEGVLELPATIHLRHLSEDIMLTGLEESGELQRIFDSTKRLYLAVPTEGAVISESLADKLSAKIGDKLELVTPATGDDRLPITISGIVSENVGSGAYMEIGRLCSLLGADKTVSSLLLRTEDNAALKNILTDAKNTETLTDQAEQRQITQSMLDQSIGVNVGVFCIIGLGIAIAIIASSASISLSERTREYATLRVLGMGPGDIGVIMVLEYALLTALAILPGIPLAVGFRALMISAMSDDGALALSLYIAPVHYLVGGLICLATVALTNLSSIRQISRLEMTDVLKERE